MRKIIILFLAFMTLAAISCKKDSMKEQVSPEKISTKEQVSPEILKISLSTPAVKADSATHKAATASTLTDVKNGDTTTFNSITDINILASALNEKGEKIDGQWWITTVETDHSPDYFYNGNQENFIGAITTFKLKTLGLYKLSFLAASATQDKMFSCYIKNIGIPGDTGDKIEQGSYFRIGVDRFKTSTGIEDGYTLYLKRTKDEFANVVDPNDPTRMNPSLIKNFFALTSTGNDWGGYKQFELKECKYSSGYVYFSLVKKNYPPNVNGVYQIIYGSGIMAVDWYGFLSVPKSTFRNKDFYSYMIEFVSF